MKAGLITASVTQLYKTDEFHATGPGKLRARSENSEAPRGEHIPARPGPAAPMPDPGLPSAPGSRSGAGCRMRGGRTGVPARDAPGLSAVGRTGCLSALRVKRL